MRMFEDVASTSARSGLSNLRAFQPRFDVRELKDAYELQGELPGIAQKDINVEWEDGHTLTISGHIERHSETPSPEGKHETGTEVSKSTSKGLTTVEEPRYWVTERSIGDFQRSWTFPSNVDQEHVKASLKDGILSIIVPKATHKSTKKITIE